MLNTICFRVSVTLLILSTTLAHAYNWNENDPLPIDGLSNPYALKSVDLKDANRAGRLHALNYPVTVTGALLPYQPTLKMFDRFFGSLDKLGELLGLNSYPEKEGEGPYFIPFKDGARPDVRMGVSILETKKGKGISFSCAACHSASLFGRQVLGMTNRFPKANKMFVDGKKGINAINSNFFQATTGASDDETAMFKETKNNLRSVEARPPRALGLDTSLAHVALSLSHRSQDEWATKTAQNATHPRREPLRSFVADSKPAVWWNVKYKNKWLLDGSVVSGNPIYTNILWNEIGRGTDLKELKSWLDANPETIAELTTAVYQSEPPLLTDFIDPTQIDMAAAKRGEVIFEKQCSRCHGTYEKGWSSSQSLSLAEQMKTVKVNYFAQTPIVDVGTDPQRRQAMDSLLQLNDLQISRDSGIKIVTQPGYVPPPLIGIWARYPYFHNNSAPTLCDVLSPVKMRTKEYLAREAVSLKDDFDQDCNGYPRKTIWPADKLSEKFFDTRREGQSNVGHEQMLLNDEGREKLSTQQKEDLIRYLQLL